MQKTILVVTSKYLLRKKLVNRVLELLNKEGYFFNILAVEDITKDTELLEYPVIIYCLGACYYDQSLHFFSNYVKKGGKLIVLSGNPFSQPYVIDKGQVIYHKECSKGIRAFGFVDTFLEVSLPQGPFTLKVLRKEFGEKQEQIDDLCSVWSGLYHLSVSDEQGEMQNKAQLVSIVGLLDESEHQLASPVVDVRITTGGSLCFFSWENSSGNILESELAGEVLMQVCQQGLVKTPVLEAEMEYAFYYPTETPTLCVKSMCNEKITDIRCNLTISKLQEQSKENICERNAFSLNNECQIALPVTEEGQYEVILDIFLKDIWVNSLSTGFYLLSEKALFEAVKNISPIQIRPHMSTDFCIRENKPYPICGTTYFVTDVFQKCFLHFNLSYCERDLGRLRKDGFNVLRSGNWMLNVEFLGEEGTICERARRALYAYFLCACKYDFIVQFTLGCVTLNDWDRNKCAVHNPENTEKVLTLIDCFTKLYRIFPNVMLDLVNEPSYSYSGSWTLGRPSYDPYEKKAWQNWLSDQYKTIENLRQAWGENSVKIVSFDSLTMPEEKDFEGTFYRTEVERNHTKVVDFYRFARESYSTWLGKIRRLARKNAPDMMVIMGRDESLRVPCEQDEVLQGNLDMVCWHQWNQNSITFTEYMLNRVKGVITCAQELGIYRVEKMRGGKILSDVRIANQLIRKVLFGFGNWIQWQSFDNPDKAELSENMLGLYRADGSETAAMQKLRRVIAAEKQGADWYQDRQEDAFPILTVYGTSSHFSAYSSPAQNALRNHIQILFRKLRNQSDMMLEHLFDRNYQWAMGNPKLIILPGVMRLSQHCWEELLFQVERGAVMLISGCVEEDEHFCRQERIGLLEEQEMEYIPVKDYEFIEIGGVQYLLDFRKECGFGEVQNVLKMAIGSGGNVGIKEYRRGEGKIIYCPLPLELAADTEAACALYQYAINVAHAQNRIFQVMNPQINESFEIHAIVYKSATVYTIINDGPAADMELLDIRSRRVMYFKFAELGMGKIWVGEDGSIVNEYLLEGSVRMQ